MNSRPLLDYLAYSDELPEAPTPEPTVTERAMDPIEARLKDLEARLRTREPMAAAPKQDLTLSAQIDAILKRKVAPQSMASQPSRPMHAAPQANVVEPAPRMARVVLDPPPSTPVSGDLPAVSQDFLRFAEAVYLIGQAARRFLDEPQSLTTQIPSPSIEALESPKSQTQAPPAPVSPSTGDIEALSAVLRETVSAFRSVADDLAVSAGEIRNHATRDERLRQRLPERQPDHWSERRRHETVRQRDDMEILELRESIAELQHRLDDLVNARRRPAIDLSSPSQ